MKKTYIMISLTAVACLANAASTVSSSGNWSAIATWSDSIVPGLSSSAPLNELLFGSSGLNLNVDTNAWVNTINSGANAVSNISIDSGKTLTLTNAGTDGLKSASASNKVNIGGEGTFAINATSGEMKITSGEWTFDTKVNQKGRIFVSGATNRVTLNINQDWSNAILSINKATINLNANVTTAYDRGFGAWGASSILNMAAGTKLSAGAFCMNSGNIAGSILSKGTSNESYNMAFGSDNVSNRSIITFGATMDATSTATSSISIIRNCDIVINSTQDSIKNNTKFFWGNANITLNTSGVFNTNYQMSQKNSFITIGNSNRQGVISATITTLTLNADNEFGGFEFVSGSILNIANNGHDLYIGALTLYDSGSLDVKFKDLQDFTVKLMSLDNVETFEEDGFTRAYNLTWNEGEYDEYVYLIADLTNGGWWVNSTSAVPEPAAYAALFGAIALACATARRRK